MTSDISARRLATRLAHLGRDKEAAQGFVNPPIYRGSTTLFASAEAMIAREAPYPYGLPSNPLIDQLCELVGTLEGGDAVVAVPSGLAATALVFTTYLKAGDHLLMTDSVYQPTRRFLEEEASRLGIETSYYDPLVGAGIAELIRPNTRMIFLESPGSQSMEIQDVPAIVAAAKAKGVLTAIDNTWATPIYFPAHSFGVDISLHAATKYFGGHSDILMGTVSALGETLALRLRQAFRNYGWSIGGDEAALCIRGLRSLPMRLKAQSEAALKIAHWLAEQPEVARVLHPALPSHPQHDLWQRDFSGASSLFSIIFKPFDQRQANDFINRLELFGIGYSWAGFESLVIGFNCKDYRTVTTWDPGGPTVRFSIGFEDSDDLIADIQQALAAFGQR